MMTIDDLLTFSSIETNGIRLQVATAGAPKDPTVILLHGFPEFWYGQAQPTNKIHVHHTGNSSGCLIF